MRLNPATQYADDRNLAARQRLWQQQDPPFDLMNWVLDLAGIAPGERVLEVGCGNGRYLRALRDRGARAAGCDLSPGILRTAGHPALLNASVTALPVRDGAVDVVLACHMLDLVPDRPAAIRELRRVLAAGGRCVAVTNGAQHIRALRDAVERAVRRDTPGWRQRPSAGEFTAENGAAQLAEAFADVALVRPDPVHPVVIRDAAVAADYVASMADHYQDEVARPWADVVEDVRSQVQAVISDQAAFTTYGDVVAFVGQA
ncbi:MAG: class I SAM-dependent methyltransferase [Streptosporangiaceae bacterium]